MSHVKAGEGNSYKLGRRQLLWHLKCLFLCETGHHEAQADLRLNCVAEDSLELDSLVPVLPAPTTPSSGVTGIGIQGFCLLSYTPRPSSVDKSRFKSKALTILGCGLEEQHTMGPGFLPCLVIADAIFLQPMLMILLSA